MSLRALNLNLLPILQALLHERSVSLAADALAMSQSAASEALAKLRATFEDPLLIRVGSRMELSPRAQMMVAPLDDLCRSLDIFHRHPQFDAINAERTFIIASNDYATNRMAPPVLSALRTQAPGISLRFQSAGGQMITQLVAGEIDFALVPRFFLDDLPPETLRYQPLFADRAVVIFDRNHPLSSRPAVGKDDLDAYRMVAFHPGALRLDRRHLYAFSGGQPYSISALVPEVALIPALIRGSLDFAIVPERFPGAHVAHSDIVICPLDYDLPKLEVGLVWGPLQDTDSGHRWLRERIRDELTEDVRRGASLCLTSGADGAAG